MSAVKSESLSEKGIFQHDLRDEEYLNCLKEKYISFLSRNYGPKGKATLVQTSGGNNVLSSSSSSLTQQLSFLHPTFKYINALMNAQNQSYGVHGLYVGLLCSELLYRVLRLEESVPFSIISEISLWIIEEFMQKFEHYQDKLVLDLDLGNVNTVLNFVRSVLCSKGHGVLSSDEIKHVSLKIVEAYLKTFPNEPKYGFSHIHITSLEGPSSLQTRLFEGLLYREPNYSYHELQSILSRLPKGDIKVLLLNIPLSHEASPKNESIEWCGENQLDFVYNELFSTLFKKCLKEKDIHILANQKYIHPMVKHELEREGILVMERLGASLAQSLMQISGCCPVVQLSNLDSDISEETLGHLSYIDVVIIEEKLFLNLRSIRASQNSTLLLSGVNVHVVEYLKETVDSCICLLRMAAQDPSMIVGGGCLEIFFSIVIKEMKLNSSSLAAQFDVTLSEVTKVFDAFIGVFTWLSILTKGGPDKKPIDFSFDSSHYHLWEVKNPGEEEERRSISEHFSLLPDRCGCKTFFKCELDSGVGFIPVTLLKEDSFILPTPLFGNDNLDSKIMNLRLEDGSHNSRRRSYTLPNSQSQPSCLSAYNGYSWSSHGSVTNSFSQSSYLSTLVSGSNSHPTGVSLGDGLCHGGATSQASQPAGVSQKQDRLPSREDCILDYLPAKRNALRLAFEGFSELHQVGTCVFDK